MSAVALPSPRRDWLLYGAVIAVGAALDIACRLLPAELPFFFPWEFSWVEYLGVVLSLLHLIYLTSHPKGADLGQLPGTEAYRDVLRSADADLRFVHLTGDRGLIAQRLSQRVGHYMPASLLEPSSIMVMTEVRPSSMK